MPKCSGRWISPISWMSPEMACLAESTERVEFGLHITDARESMDLSPSWLKSHEEWYWKPSTLPCSNEYKKKKSNLALIMPYIWRSHCQHLIEGSSWSVEACLTSLRNQRYGQLATQYHQKTNEDSAGCFIPMSTAYNEHPKNPRLLFWNRITALSPCSKMSRDFDKADKLTFPPWQRQLRCRYRGLHIPWQTFTKRLDLSLCTNSVSVSFIFYFLLLVPPIVILIPFFN